jgi:nitroreductase
MSLSLDDLEKLKHAPPVHRIPDLILHRWSPRSFADKDISSEDLTKLFEAARWAASSFNEQPWRFFVGRRDDKTWKKIFESLVEFNQVWAKSAPVLILSIARKTFSHNNQPNAYGLHDTGAATATLSLQATALGMHTHSMAGFDHEKARRLFHVPADHDMGAVTAVGYLGHPEELPEPMQQNEIAPRTRKPLSEFVFAEFDEPASL